MNHMAQADSSIALNGLTSYSQSRKCIVFKDTDIPVVYLWDAVMNDETVSDFVSRFPAVSKDTAFSVIRLGARVTDGF